MRTKLRGADRLWAAGGAVVAVTLAALSWLFLISAQNSTTDDLRAETEQVNDQVVVLQARLNQLRKENENLAEYQAKLATGRKALPTSTALSDFLREMQAAGEHAGVAVTAVSAGTGATTRAAGADMQVVPMTLTVSGGIDGQIAFLDQLQRFQPRAVLIIGTNLVPADNSDSLGGTVTMTLSIQIFVAVQPTPTPSASASSAAASPTD
jgi:Tfp pilus assembly protein PilO